MPIQELPLTAQQDDELVTMAQAGNDAAFTELLRRHHNACMKLAMSILRDKSDAEDEVQTACWKAYEHLQQFNRDARFSTWLTRIVVNQCLMRLRQARRAKFFYLDNAMIGDEVGAFDLPAPEPGPEQELGRRELSQVLDQEIRRIPPLLRKVFLLRDVEQLPMQDVADKLWVTVAAAKSRLLRARSELRARLARHEGRGGAATLLG